MQTSIIDAIRDTPDGQEADRILRACTHCGFCTATCPTYQLTGDERDGPRGRIYLVKQMLEGHAPTEKTRHHLDRCLTCRACETTCPSGVEYAKLADIGRDMVDQRLSRSPRDKALRWGLRHIVAYRQRFAFVLAVGRAFSPLLVGPLAPLRAKIPPARLAVADLPQPTDNQPETADRSVLIFEGCVQPSAAPHTNAAATRLLGRLGIQSIAPVAAGCCGALSQHLSHREEARHFARANIDAWWPHIENGAEAIVITASGCGAQIAEYGYLLRDDPAYAARAAYVSALTRDLSDVLAHEDLSQLGDIGHGRTVSYHPPCTLQNAPHLHDHVADILTQAGYRLNHVANSHLCCGSAGAYSIMQPEMAGALRDNKIRSLGAGDPDMIVTANIGCQLYLETGTGIPVRHWIELLEPVS